MSLKIHPALLVEGIHKSFENKKAFHRHGVAFMRNLVEELGLIKGKYHISSNKAGPACSGEITLHGEKIYVQLGEMAMHKGASVMFRQCNGVNDFHGKANNFVKVIDLTKPELCDKFIHQCKDLCGLLVDNDFDSTLRM